MIRRYIKLYLIFLCMIPLLLIIIFLLYLFGVLFISPLFEEKGGYLVEYVNSDVNPCKDKERYFYLYDKGTLGSYSFEDGTTQEHISLSDENQRISDYAVWEEDIYYVIEYNVKVKGHTHEYELRKLNYETGEETVLIPKEDMDQFHGNETIRSEYYVYVEVYGGYVFFELTSGYEYMCPIDGNMLTDSFDVDTLFQEEDESGEIQQVVYDGIQVERYFNGKRYVTVGIRGQGGYNIMVDADKDRSAYVEGQRVQFRRERYPGDIQYSLDGQRTWQPVTCLQEKIYKMSDIYEEYLTVEDGKIIGLLCVSDDPYMRRYLMASDIRKDVLLEMDIDTGESRILYDTKNNKTKIIGYRDGIVYLVKAGKVYSQQLDGSERIELFNLPKDGEYRINWQAGYLIIRTWDVTGNWNEGEIIEVYNTNA